MRVLTTINQSSFSPQLRSQQSDLVRWVDEILTGVWKHQVKLRAFPLIVQGSTVTEGKVLDFP
jgi:hypothetical protein